MWQSAISQSWLSPCLNVGIDRRPTERVPSAIEPDRGSELPAPTGDRQRASTVGHRARDRRVESPSLTGDRRSEHPVTENIEPVTEPMSH